MLQRPNLPRMIYEDVSIARDTRHKSVLARTTGAHSKCLNQNLENMSAQVAICHDVGRSFICKDFETVACESCEISSSENTLPP